MSKVLRVAGCIAGFFVVVLSLVIMAIGAIMAVIWLLMGWLGTLLLYRVCRSVDGEKLPLKAVFSKNFFINSGMIGAPRLAEALMVLGLFLSGFLPDEDAAVKKMLGLPPPE